jgi:hypothetical protein
MFDFLTKPNEIIMIEMVNNIDAYILMFTNEASDENDDDDSSASEENKEPSLSESKNFLKPKGNFERSCLNNVLYP